MNSYRIQFFIFLILNNEIKLINGNNKTQPSIRSENGNLIIESAENRNITFAMEIFTGRSFFVNNFNLLPAINRQLHLNNISTADDINEINSKLNELNFKVMKINRRLETIDSFDINSTEFLGKATEFSLLNISTEALEKKVLNIETILTENNCQSSPCQHGGTCVDGYDKFFCQCPPEWQGDNCNQDVNECSFFSGTGLGCQNGGTCVNTAGGYSCTCPQNFIGIHCGLRAVDCGTASTEICGHGYCVNRNTNIGYECICEPGWKKNSPATGAPACVIDINECESEEPHCSKDPLVICRNIDGSYICGPCPLGYSGNGHYCTDINECETNNGGCSISPTVTCHNTIGSFSCGQCPLGFQGDGKICIRANLCNGFQMCHPLATCMEYSSEVSCMCPDGYTGNGFGSNGCIQVQVEPCIPNPCLNGGDCIKNGNSSICNCPTGTSPPLCELTVNLCIPNPCRNGGTCTIEPDGRQKCICRNGFTGRFCLQQETSCGISLLDAPTGVLKYPRDNSSTYNSRDRCAWVIKTNFTHVLNVTFTQFNLEQSYECRFDWLQIHDGRSTEFPLIGRFCGNKLPKNGNFLSTHNMLYFWFRADNSSEHEGFELKWESVLPKCGSIIETTSHGTISSPGSPGNYPINRDCFWYIGAPPGKRIRLTFYMVQIENHSDCDHDKLEFYSGTDAPTKLTLLEKFCNRTYPPPLITPHNELTIYFHSDGDNSDKGFQIHYAVVEGYPGCGGTYTEVPGEISSPNTNGSYPNNIICEYIIRLRLNALIKLKFLKFDIEKNDHCTRDKLSIYDGPNEYSPLINHYCGTTLPADVISQSNVIFVKFRTDWSTGGGGFRISYDRACSGTFQDPIGNITSPNYPERYDTLMSCDYIIGAPMGNVIRLQFIEFDLERDRNCVNDYVEIYDGFKTNETQIGKYCGAVIPEVILSETNFLHILFSSDYFGNGRGFMANYAFVETAKCGGVLRNPVGRIESPNYNDGDLPSKVCRWIIYAPIGQIIQLQFITFEIEFSPRCSADSIEIFDSSTQHGGSIGKFCGTQKPPMITSSENIVTIIFTLDEHERQVFSGFSATYEFMDASHMCGANYFSTSGYIQSPGWPEQYLPEKFCEWTITVPAGQQIILNPKTFELEQNQVCLFDYLEIRNGGTAKSPLIGKFCGKTLKNPIKSLGNKLYLKFVSDHSRQEKGFEIEYDGTATGCGGILNSQHGLFTSPNYPDPYEWNTLCTWEISVSQGSIIELIINVLDLDRTDNCTLDYVDIYNGRDTLAPRIGRYCKITAQKTIVSKTNYLHIRMITKNWFKESSTLKTGFTMTYRAICNVNLTEHTGVIESPNFPGNYPNRLYCNWKIQGSKGNQIFLLLTHFDLEFCEYEDEDNLCYYDNLKIIEKDEQSKEKNHLFKKKIQLPLNITSDKNVIEIIFDSDTSGTGTGFRIEYQTIGCGEILRKSNGTFNSPNYPNLYPKDTHCNWTIITNFDQSVELTIHNYNFNNCSSSGLIVSNYENDAGILTRLCGSSLNKTIITGQGHQMFISFYSDNELQKKGFTAFYRFISTAYGGKITAPTGFITSPNYPNNYLNNLNVEWLIEIDQNHLIEFHIMDFNFDPSHNCENDKFLIYDGNERLEHKNILKSCNETVPKIQKYISSTNQLLIIMETDGTSTRKGFKMNYTIACGAVIQANSTGIIKLSDQIYETQTECLWIIKAGDYTKRITFNILHFSGFLADECNHRLEIYDGDTIESPQRMIFCGERDQVRSIQSSGQYLTVTIKNIGVNRVGPLQFTATYSIYDTACGGDINSLSGTIASPNYPNSYPFNSECTWKLLASPGNKLGIIIKDLNIAAEIDQLCNENYLEIREKNEYGNNVGVYCGKNPTTNLTSAEGYFIKFRSGNVAVSKGFRIEYFYYFHNEIAGNEGSLTSPLYPYDFLDQNQEFTWRIMVEHGSIISMQFIEFYIDIRDGECISKLEIYDGYDNSGRTISETPYCGYQNGIKIKSTSNVLYISLTQLEIEIGTKFNLKWKTIQKEIISKNMETDEEFEKTCGGNRTTILTNFTVVNLQSPGYPKGYNNSLDCSWIYTANVTGFHLVFSLMEVDFERYESCYGNFIQISNSTNMIDWVDSKKICSIEDYLTHPNYHGDPFIKISFNTNYMNEGGFFKGFFGTVSLICGGTLNGQHGVLIVDKVRRSYFRPDYNYDDCSWTIKVRQGKRIKFSFDKFKIGNKTEKCTISLIFKNGPNEFSPNLGDEKYCGTNIPEIPETFSNYAYIKLTHHFNSDIEFTLRYDEIDQNCKNDIILTSESNSTVITTPGGLNPYISCYWSITVPSGEYLKIEYLEFDLMTKIDCEIEYLEIRSGATSFSSLYSRECGSKIPTTKIIKNNYIYLLYETKLDEPRPGFKIKISIFGCGAVHEAPNGILTSPNFPAYDSHQSNLDCEYHIIGTVGSKLKLEFEEFQLPGQNDQNCTSDYIEILTILPYDLSCNCNKNHSLGKFCGTNKPPLIISSTNLVMIKYKTFQSHLDLAGWKLSYNSSIEKFIFELNAESGTITTIGYPNSVQLIGHYQWEIKVPIGRRITAKIIEFDIDENTENAFVVVYNDYKFDSHCTADDFLTNTDQYVNSSDNIMIIKYFCIKASNHRGFKLTYTSNEETICKGDLSGTTGRFTNLSEKSYFCNYERSTPLFPGKNNFGTISFKIDNVTTDNRVCFARIASISFVYDSNKEFKTICSKVSNITIAMPAFTSLGFSAIQSIYMKPMIYNMSYQLHQCGGLLNGDFGDEINQLSFTENYGNLDCAWQVIYDETQKIEFNLTLLNLTLPCDKEYITVYQGETPESPKIPPLCRELNKNSSMSFLSQTNSLFIEYHTENYTRDTKFQIKLQPLANQCGGLIKGHAKYLSSPKINKNSTTYPNNAECIWEIMVDPGLHIGLKFYGRYQLEDSTNCSKDYIEIYDFKDDNWILLGSRLCGRDMPAVRNSTGTRMKVIFRSDDEINGDGFSAIWHENCGGILTATENLQYLASPNYPNLHPGSLFCNYTIKASQGEIIEVKFLGFVKEESLYGRCNIDKLKIYRKWRYNKEIQEIGSFCEEMSIPDLSFEEIGIIVLKTDRYGAGIGFRLSYQVMSCGGLITTPKRIASPINSNDQTHPNSLKCFWNITAPTGKKIIIEMDMLELEQSPQCYHDFVEIFSSKFPNPDARIAKVCGNHSAFAVNIPNQYALIYFQTDYSNSFRGFSASIRFTYFCEHKYYLSTDNPRHEVEKQSTGNPYDCHYLVKSPIDTTINVHFEKFNISPCNTVSSKTNCACDFLEIRDGFSSFHDLIGRYCGDSIPSDLRISTSSLWMRFSTYGSLNTTGFKIIFELKESICGPMFYNLSKSETALIASPRNLNYLPNFRCSWNIIVPEGNSIQLEFEEFDVKRSESNDTCSNHILEINVNGQSGLVTEGDTLIATGKDMMNDYLFWTGIRTPYTHIYYCGSEKPSNFIAEGNEVTIKFITDGSTEKSGFKIRAGAVNECVRNYTSVQGRVKKQYHGSDNCNFWIIAPQNYTLSLYFMTLYFVENNCDTSFMKIYENDKHGKLVATLCGWETPKPIFLNVSSIFVNIENNVKTDFDYGSVDFYYIASKEISGCGGQLYNYGGIFSSPYYPFNHRIDADCRWNIRVPMNNKVALKFSDFNLGSKFTCDTNFLQILEIESNTGEESIARTYCADDKPEIYRGLRSELVVRFKKTVNFDGSGFLIEFMGVNSNAKLSNY